MAFVFLFLDAVAQVFIPRYIGQMLDSLAQYQHSEDSIVGQDIWIIP